MCKSNRLILCSFSFYRGGAGVAASKFRAIAEEYLSDFSVISISQDGAGLVQFVKRIIVHALSKLQNDNNPVKHSLNLSSYKRVSKSLLDDFVAIHHINWINNDTLGVFDLHKIPSGSILTLHDEWLYCGAEHYAAISEEIPSFVKGYRFFQSGVYGIHWNFIIWWVKKKKLSDRPDLIFTVPSRWMLERARSSVILRNADIRYLPNPIDTSVFKRASSIDVAELRAELRLSQNDFVIVFGAVGGRSNPLKGSLLLEEALQHLKSTLSDTDLDRIKLVDFGGTSSGTSCWQGFHSISIGYISEPEELALLYSLAQCVVVPSLVESFGQVAAEAASCETPVVCFHTSGLRDVVMEGETGFLAECFSAESLAQKIKSVIEMPDHSLIDMGVRARRHVQSNFSYSVVKEKYFEIIRDAEAIKKEYLQ
ncbi:glycosyltransferase [Marinobacter shengliensis]